MTKTELLAMDALSLQKYIKELTPKKEKLEEDIKRLHRERQEKLEELQKPLPALESALKLLRIEAESLSVQIGAKKKELEKLAQLHSTVLDNHGQTIANKKQTVLFQENLIGELQEEIEKLEKSLQNKKDEVVSLAKQIQTLSFEVTNYQKTILLISNQEKELIVSLRSKVAIEKKLDARIKELKRTHHIVVEDVLTERNKRLYKRHKQMTHMNKALDVQVDRKRSLIK
jgi:chromosome segregation ATPase